MQARSSRRAAALWSSCGTVTNGGTLFANSAGDQVAIAIGAVVNGGVALIGDGIVDIAGSSGESVKFLSTRQTAGSKSPIQPGQTSAFSGRVSGFGGSGPLEQRAVHRPAVRNLQPGMYRRATFPPMAATPAERCSSPAAALVAAINFVGTYSAGNFTLVTDHLRRQRHSRDHRSGGAQRRQRQQRYGQVLVPAAAASICRTSPSARRRRSPMQRTAPAPAAR